MIATATLVLSGIAATAALIAAMKRPPSDAMIALESAERLAARGNHALAAEVLCAALDGIPWDRVNETGRATWIRRARKLGRVKV